MLSPPAWGWSERVAGVELRGFVVPTRVGMGFCGSVESDPLCAPASARAPQCLVGRLGRVQGHTPLLIVNAPQKFPYPFRVWIDPSEASEAPACKRPEPEIGLTCRAPFSSLSPASGVPCSKHGTPTGLSEGTVVSHRFCDRRGCAVAKRLNKFSERQPRPDVAGIFYAALPGAFWTETHNENRTSASRRNPTSHSTHLCSPGKATTGCAEACSRATETRANARTKNRR